MTPMNGPDATDGLSPQAAGLYPPIFPSTDVPVPSPAATSQEEVASAWAEGLRCTVRDHPLATVAAAAALGMLLARLTR